jgi:hypothetical protein
VEDEDLIRFLKRYGYTGEREHPTYKLCKALFDSSPKGKDEEEEFLPFKKGDEMVVGYFSASRGWSVVLLVKQPYDYVEQKRKWCLVSDFECEFFPVSNKKVPNVYINVVDYWQESEMK